MRTPSGRAYAERNLRDEVNSLSYSEYKQLRTLKAVYDNPTITGIWVKADCERLVALGFAKRIDIYPEVAGYSITLRGLDALALVGA